MRISEKARRALMIGTLCSISYFAVYIARNILSVVEPEITGANGVFTNEDIGTISSIYFIAYAVGQLVNGFIGDRIKPKYMISGGLVLAGITNFVFPYVTFSVTTATAVYAVTGFSLAMIYAPMMKIVSENTEHIYAVRCSFGYTFASFFATPTAGLLAMFLAWDSVFRVSSSILGIMGIVSFVFFTAFERRGIVKYGQYEKKETEKGSIKALFEHSIVRFTLIAIVTGIVRTSVVFWLNAYINEYLNFGEKESTGIYTAATFIISMMSIIAILIYEFFGRRRDSTMIVMFAMSAVFFLLAYFISSTWVNIVLIVLAIMASNGAAAILWSVYCPSLRDTGRVSTATGFLDFSSYMAAAVANKAFPAVISSVGWSTLILIWCTIVFAGFLIMLPYGRVKDFIRMQRIKI